MATEKTFLELVEFHERKWGTEQYPGRPTLKLLLNMPIVVMWRVGKRFMFSVHSHTHQLEKLITGLITGQYENPDNRTLYRVYIHQQEFPFSVKLVNANSGRIPDAEGAQIQEQEKQSASITTAKKFKPWHYAEQPEIVDTNPQRAIRDIPPYQPHYIPQVIDRNGKKSNLQPVRQSPVFPGRNDPHLPGRKVRIVKTRLSKSDDTK